MEHSIAWYFGFAIGWSLKHGLIILFLLAVLNLFRMRKNKKRVWRMESTRKKYKRYNRTERLKSYFWR